MSHLTLVVNYIVTTSEQCNISFTTSLNNMMYLLPFTSESLRPGEQVGGRMRSLNLGESNSGMPESRARGFLPPWSPQLSQAPGDFLPGQCHLATQVLLWCGSQKGVSSVLVTFREVREICPIIGQGAN